MQKMYAITVNNLRHAMTVNGLVIRNIVIYAQ